MALTGDCVLPVIEPELLSLIKQRNQVSFFSPDVGKTQGVYHPRRVGLQSAQSMSPYVVEIVP
jgi:hypothetical protein